MTTVCGLTISFEMMSIGWSTDERHLIVNAWSLFALLPLATHFICVELYCIACLWFIVLHGFVAWTWTWFVMCDELRWLVILLSCLCSSLWFDEVVLIMSKLHIIYISCVVLPRFPLVGETPSKFSKFIYMCSWYSFKFRSTYQGGVLSTHRT